MATGEPMTHCACCSLNNPYGLRAFNPPAPEKAEIVQKLETMKDEPTKTFGSSEAARKHLEGLMEPEPQRKAEKKTCFRCNYEARASHRAFPQSLTCHSYWLGCECDEENERPRPEKPRGIEKLGEDSTKPYTTLRTKINELIDAVNALNREGLVE